MQFIDETCVDLHNEMIEQSKNLYHERIPHFYITVNLITIIVNIGDIKLKAMIDTGANCCVFYKKSVERCKLEYLIDSEEVDNINAAQGAFDTNGKIWYLDINIQNYSLPCAFTIVDNSKDHEFDMILGINFLAAHRINIDFHTRKLIFSQHFQQSFNL